MERLLTLRLRSVGCAAEARLNDVPVARTPAAGGSASLPVHEYLTEGDNEIALVIDPVAVGAEVPARWTEATIGASLRLLLPRVGQPAAESSARALAEIDWALAEGELHVPPVVERRILPLAVKFPRWRWFDAPALTDAAAVRPLVAGFVQPLALALARGDADAFVTAARVRFEDLALAYQQPLADLVARWRSRVQLLHATKSLRLVPPTLADVMLRPCGHGRLLEVVSPTGEPLLHTGAQADGTRHVWPIRIAVVEGRCHIVR